MQPDDSAAPPTPRTRRDLLVVCAVALAAAALFATIELSESIQSVTRPLEAVQLDELPYVLFVLALALIWFAWRRWRDARSELARRIQAERTLAQALADNRRLARESVNAQEAERRSLARELHDELGQTVNAIKIDAVQVRERASSDEDRRLATDILKHVDHLHATVRERIRLLRPVALDELGLPTAIEVQIDDWRPRLPQTNIRCDLSAGLDELDEATNIALYRVLQESMTNVAKHARAKRVGISAGQITGTDGVSLVRLRIENDGASTHRTKSRVLNQGLGLIGMDERVRALGGLLTIAIESPDRFVVEAVVPANARTHP